MQVVPRHSLENGLTEALMVKAHAFVCGTRNVTASTTLQTVPSNLEATFSSYKGRRKKGLPKGVPYIIRC